MRTASYGCLLLGMLVGCASQRPGATPPLTPTPDAPFRAAPPALAAEPLLTPPSARLFQLRSGLTVAVVERADLPGVSAVFASRRARDGVAPELMGLAAFTAFAVGAAAETRDDDRSSAGRPVHFSAQISDNGTTLRVAGPARDLDGMLQSLSAALRKNIAEVDVRIAHSEFRAVMSRRLPRFQELLWRTAVTELYGREHPLAATLKDASDNERQFSLERVRAFHAQNYGPRDSLLVVAGAVEAAQVQASAERWFGDWVETLPAPAPTGVQRSPSVAERRRDLQAISRRDGRGFVLVAAPCVASDDPAALTFDVIGALLTRVTSSPFAQRIRHESGTSYTWHAACAGNQRGGTFFVRADSDPERVGEALSAIVDELQRLTRETISADELASAQASFLAGRAAALIENDDLAMALARLHLQALALDSYSTLEQRVRSITAEQVREVAARHFSSSQLAMAVCGDDRLLPAQLHRFGAWRWSDVVRHP